jgi:hydrogenase 3 maturation protease
MSSLNTETTISDFLKGFERLTFLAVGSELRSDDGAALRAADELLKYDLAQKAGKLQILKGYTAPENFTGEIKRFNPTHIIICDAAYMALKPGSISFVDPQKIHGGSYSTHRMPMNVFLNYLNNTINAKALIIGIEPKNTGFGMELSKDIENSAVYLAKIIYNTITL